MPNLPFTFPVSLLKITTSPSHHKMEILEFHFRRVWMILGLPGQGLGWARRRGCPCDPGDPPGAFAPWRPVCWAVGTVVGRSSFLSWSPPRRDPEDLLWEWASCRFWLLPHMCHLWTSYGKLAFGKAWMGKAKNLFGRRVSVGRCDECWWFCGCKERGDL